MIRGSSNFKIDVRMDKGEKSELSLTRKGHTRLGLGGVGLLGLFVSFAANHIS